MAGPRSWSAYLLVVCLPLTSSLSPCPAGLVGSRLLLASRLARRAPPALAGVRRKVKRDAAVEISKPKDDPPQVSLCSPARPLQRPGVRPAVRAKKCKPWIKIARSHGSKPY